MILFALFACDIGSKSLDSGFYQPLDIFCDDMDEAGTLELIDGGASGSNGRLEAQLISSTGNARDTNIIGNATYILESIDVGGGQRQGQATPLGEILVTLGAGNWSLRVQSASGFCSNDLEFEISAETTHKSCIPLNCD